MNKNSYEQFFTEAKGVKDKVRFSVKEKTPKPVKLRVRKAKPPFPWKAVVGLAVSLGLSSWYFLAPEHLENLASKVEISAFGAASAAEEKAAEKSKANVKEAEKPASAQAKDENAKPKEERSEAAEELSHYEKLKQRKEELDSREKELAELEEELQRQKVELDKRITQLEDMRNQIAQTLKDRVDVDQDKVNKLVDLYSNMKPKQAADILGSLNEELAVEVLAKMKKKSAAEIMNLLPPEKARVLSEKYTGYRRISSLGEPKG